MVESLTASVFENGMDAPTFVISRTGNAQGDLTVNYSVGGTTTAGVDYSVPPGVIIIPSGQTSRTVKIPLIDDKLLEGEETVVLTITPNVAYTLGSSSASTTVRDDDLLTVTIAPTSAGLAEPSAT